MNRNYLLLLATTVMLSPAIAFGQSPPLTSSGGADAGSSVPEGTSITAQVSACTVSCLQRVLSGDIRLDQCVAGVPECAGLESDASAVRAGICEQAHDLVSQCDAVPPTEVTPTDNTTRPRPRRLQLICQNGSTVGEGWRAHCVCAPDRVGVDESRYVLPVAQRRARYSRTSATVVRVVYCVPQNEVASARQAVHSDLDERVAALESIVGNLDTRVAALEARPAVSADGVSGPSEDRVREIVSDATRGFVTHAELQEVTDGLGEVSAAQDRRIEMIHGRLRCLEGDTGWQEFHLADGSTQRYRCRHHADADASSGTSGSFGFRLSGLLSIGFRPLSYQDQNSTVPVYLASELGITVSVADHWYLEGALGFGYAFEDTPFGDAFQGQYRVGVLHLLDAGPLPIGFAFGGILTERYNGGFASGTFTSDHTLAGGYLEALFNTPAHGAAFYAFVRFTGGAGLRFYNVNDHVSFDGGIQFGVGVARFGDH